MRTLSASLLAAVAVVAGCASGPSQSGPIAGCAGVSLGGQAAFAPRGGMIYQSPVVLGTGTVRAGPQVVVIWGTVEGGLSADAGPSDFGSICALAKSAGLPTNFTVAPISLSFNLGDTLTSGDSQAALIETAANALNPLADPAAGISLGNVGSGCVSGSFNASVAPAHAIDDTPIDGGLPTPLTGNFDLPRCQ